MLDLRAANQELHETREGLDRAQRLAAVGHLAAGVAHEVGNPIGAMLAFIDLARRDAGTSEAAKEHLERAGAQGARVRTILRQLLDLSRPPEGRIGPVDLAECAEQAASLVRAQEPYRNVTITIHEELGAPRAQADAGVLGQILLNLLLNAGDELAAQGGGRVEVSIAPAVRHVRAGEDAEAARQRARADAVSCTVSDDGPGIDEEDRSRVFDPFFTTKDPGRGTGLGLTTVQRLVESLSGSVDLESPGPLGGASFRMTFPAVARARAADAQETRTRT